MDSINVLLIDNEDSFTYNIVELLRKAENVEYDVINVKDNVLSKINSPDKIIISPGPGVPNDYPVLNRIIETYKNTKPILGVCLGHQLICTHFGSRLINMDSVIHGLQQKVEIIEKDKLLNNISDEFKVGLYHSWVVDRYSVPEELKITALSKKGYLMGVGHKKYDIYGIQFHPESFLTGSGTKIIGNFLYL